MRWITRERPKIDRVACPWLISRFIDPEAEFIFVPPTEVIDKANELDAIPYDVHGVELTHEGELCSFDAFLKKYKLDEPELRYLALIVRGADTTGTISRPKAAAYSRSPWVFLTSTMVMIRPCFGTALSFMMPCISG
jgi:hypothetical protein